MESEKQFTLKIIFGIIDIFATILSFFLAFLILDTFQIKRIIFNNDYLNILILVIPTWVFLLKKFNIAKIHRTRTFSILFLEYVGTIFVGIMFLYLYKQLFKLYAITDTFIVSFGIVNLFILYTTKIIGYKHIRHLRKHGKSVKNIVIMADEHADLSIDKILKNKQWGYNIVKIISNSNFIKYKYGQEIPIINDDKGLDIGKLIELGEVDELFYCKNEINQQHISSLIYACEEVGVPFRLQSDLLTMTAMRSHLMYFEETPYLSFMNLPSDYFALKLKEVIAYATSFIIVTLFSPIMLIIALLIKITSKGPVLFKQKRVGLRGREFHMYKFRTMIQDAEKLKKKLEQQNEMDGPVFKINNDPRITPIGRFLRKTSLDELPQLINVLKGDMTLVGPRPPIPEEVKQYKRWQLRRLSMKPGITCIWQIQPHRNKITFEQWMQLDLKYIDTWSLKLDFILIMKTIRAVIGRDGA